MEKYVNKDGSFNHGKWLRETELNENDILNELITELTAQNFQMPKQDKANKVIMALQASGMKFSMQDNKNAVRHLQDFEGGKMFIHVQYHYVQTKAGEPVYFYHQSQYWLKDQEVNVTQLYVEKYEDYENSGEKTKQVIGRALVATDKFLEGLKRLTVLKKG
tara:strand:+ start:34310 stop:34795 length:486 start_codon:yes stop_codon:yes gene_type:complete